MFHNFSGTGTVHVSKSGKSVSKWHNMLGQICIIPHVSEFLDVLFRKSENVNAFPTWLTFFFFFQHLISYTHSTKLDSDSVFQLKKSSTTLSELLAYIFWKPFKDIVHSNMSSCSKPAVSLKTLFLIWQHEHGSGHIESFCMCFNTWTTDLLHRVKKKPTCRASWPKLIFIHMRKATPWEEVSIETYAFPFFHKAIFSVLILELCSRFKICNVSSFF